VKPAETIDYAFRVGIYIQSSFRTAQGRLFLMCAIALANAGTIMRLHVYLRMHSRLRAASMHPRDFSLFLHRFACVIFPRTIPSHLIDGQIGIGNRA